MSVIIPEVVKIGNSTTIIKRTCTPSYVALRTDEYGDIIITIQRGGVRPCSCVFYGLDTMSHNLKSIGVKLEDIGYFSSYLEDKYRRYLNGFKGTQFFFESSIDHRVRLDNRCLDILSDCGLMSTELYEDKDVR